MAQAMKAARADVIGHEVPHIRRRRGQSSRDIGGRRAMFTQRHGRVLYRGSSRRRDTQVWPGHPLAGLWTSWTGMARSHRPDVRAYANAKRATFRDMGIVDEMAGVAL